MSTKHFPASDAVSEKTPAQYTCRFRDAAAGAPALNAAAITAITATLKDVGTGTAIRTAQDVRNANGGVLAADGLFTLTFASADLVVLSVPAAPFDQRRLTLTVTYTGGKVLYHEVTFYVRNLVDVP